MILIIRVFDKMLAKFHIYMFVFFFVIKKEKKIIIFTNVEALTDKKSKIDICICFDVLWCKFKNQNL